MRKMKSNKLWMFFGSCYMLFSIYLLLINLASNVRSKEIYDIIGFIISILILFLAYKFKDKIKVKDNKIIFYICRIIPIILRFSLLFLNYINIESDYLCFLSNAEGVSKNIPIDSGYVSLFPFLYPYIYLLGNLMKLFGTGYSTVIILNIILDLIGAVCFYLLVKLKRSKKQAKLAILIWLWNPFNILWITKCCPVVIVNSLLVLVMLVFEISTKDMKFKNTILLSLLLGIIISIANAFRPILIIFVIAMGIYYFVNSIYRKSTIKKNVISFSIIVLTFFWCNVLVNGFISQKIDRPLPENKSGWSIFVGSNYQYNGRWNPEDSSHLMELTEKYGNVEAHNMLKNEGISRYKELKIKAPILIIKKSKVLGTGETSYTYSDVFYSVENKVPLIVKDIILIYLGVFWYLMLLTNVILSVRAIRNKIVDDGVLIPYGIFALGLFVSTLLVEVHIRYFLPIMAVLLIFILLNYFKKFENK